MRSFLVSIQKEDKFFVARYPELGVTSQGENLEEAQANIKALLDHNRSCSCLKCLLFPVKSKLRL